MFVVAYLVLCFAVALAGRNRRIGFAGYFLLSLVLSPLVGILILFFSGWDQRRPSSVPPGVCPHCEDKIRALAEVKHCTSCGRPL